MVLSFSRETSANTYELTHKSPRTHTHTHTNGIPHTGQWQPPHRHTCTADNRFPHRNASYESMCMCTTCMQCSSAWRSDAMWDEAHTYTLSPVRCTENRRSTFAVDSRDLSTWEAVCCGRGGRSRVNVSLRKIHWNYSL